MDGFRRDDEEEVIQVSRSALCMKSWIDCNCLCMRKNSTWSFRYDCVAFRNGDPACGTSITSKSE